MVFILRGIMMNNRALAIYKSVLEAMQDADEIEGVEGDDYLKLMTAIAEESMRRFDNCIDTMASNKEAETNLH
jgi:hypothetical protein